MDRYEVREQSNGTLATAETLDEARKVAAIYARADARWCPRVTIHDTVSDRVEVVPNKWRERYA